MNPDLDNLISAARLIAVDAKAFFGGLNAAQLNWKPNMESWSVGQCLQHLTIATSKSFSEIESVVKGDYKPSFWAKIPGLPGFFGKQILKAVQPENRRKVKAPKSFRPANSDVDAKAVADFVEMQQKLIGLMEASRNIDLEKTIIVSPAASFVVYSLFDAYKIAVNHERRHFRQARNVMKLPEFPA